MEFCKVGLLAVQETTLTHVDAVGQAFGVSHYGTLAHMQMDIWTGGTSFFVRDDSAQGFSYPGPCVVAI